jgi:MFS family permease
MQSARAFDSFRDCRPDASAHGSRWLVALAGLLLMTFLGTIYSWSLFTQPLGASFGWSNMTTTCAFAFAIFFLGLGAFAGGRWQDRVGPRRIALTGAAMWGAGNILAGLGTPWLGAGWLYLSYGAIGGFGIGMAYVTPVAVVTKWFPLQRGLGSGLVVMGFGLGAVVYNLVVKSIPSFAAAAAAAADYAAARAEATADRSVFDVAAHVLTPAHMQAVMQVFVYSGMCFALVGGVCAWFLVNPERGGPLRVASPISSADAAYSYTTREMIRTPQFYALWGILFLNVTAGILIIGNAVPIMQEITGATPAVVATVFGAIAVFNAAGRLFWGAVSDRIGRKGAYALVFVLQAGIFWVLGGLHSIALAAAAYAIILFCYGGGFGIMPSFTADYFGTGHLGANYGALLTAWGVAGLAGPLLAAYVKDMTGSFGAALPIVAALLLLAALLPLVMRRPVWSPISLRTGTHPG